MTLVLNKHYSRNHEVTEKEKNKRTASKKIGAKEMQTASFKYR